MKADSLVIQGDYFWSFPEDSFSPILLEQFKSTLVRFMETKRYVCTTDLLSPKDTFWIIPFQYYFSWKDARVEMEYKVLKLLGQVTDEEIDHLKYDNALYRIIDSVPFEVNIQFRTEKLEKWGFFITVKSFPAIYYKNKKKKSFQNLNDDEYSYILTQNIQFIEDAMSAVQAVCISRPTPRLLGYKSPFEERLEKLGFKKTASLLKSVRSDLTEGIKETTLSTLRSAYEDFVRELVISQKKEPKQLHQFDENLKILFEVSEMEQFSRDLIHKASYSQIYKYVTDGDHKKYKPLNNELVLLINITENIFDFLLAVVLQRKK